MRHHLVEHLCVQDFVRNGACGEEMELKKVMRVADGDAMMLDKVGPTTRTISARTANYWPASVSMERARILKMAFKAVIRVGRP